MASSASYHTITFSGEYSQVIEVEQDGLLTESLRMLVP